MISLRTGSSHGIMSSHQNWLTLHRSLSHGLSCSIQPKAPTRMTSFLNLGSLGQVLAARLLGAHPTSTFRDFHPSETPSAPLRCTRGTPLWKAATRSTGRLADTAPNLAAHTRS